MSDRTAEVMPGDSEAAAAIAGMIETYGTAAANNSYLHTVFVGEHIEVGRGIAWWVTKQECLGKLPGNVAVLRKNESQQVFFHAMGQHSFECEADALSAVRNVMDGMRSSLTRQIGEIDAKIAALAPRAE